MVMERDISRQKNMQIAYADRYPWPTRWMIISATASPHLHIDKRGMAVWSYPGSAEESSLTWQFLWDIEEGLEDEENYICHLDELTSLSEKNQHLRFEALHRPGRCWRRILMDFRRVLFQQNRPLMDTFREHLSGRYGSEIRERDLTNSFIEPERR